MSTGKQLHSEIHPVHEITPGVLSDLFFLMDRYYCNVSAADFHMDFYKKTKVILVKDEHHVIGFSTWLEKDITLHGLTCRIIYSGDTVLDINYRGNLVFPFSWAREILYQKKNNPEKKFYWLLTTKGFRTYRYMSVFFKNYIPGKENDEHKLRLIRKTVMQEMNLGDFDPETGILLRTGLRQHIKNIDDDEFYMKRTPDPFIKSFKQLNPNYENGDELVCLAEISDENIRPAILRKLKQ